MKHSPYQFELPILVSQSVAVCQIELLPVNLTIQRLSMKNYSTFLFQVISAPYIVVTDKEMHFHSPISQFGYLSQKTGKAFRHHHFEFVPEVEHIPQHIHRRRIILDTIQEIYQTTFLRASMRDGTGTQMSIGYKIDILHRLIH